MRLRPPALALLVLAPLASVPAHAGAILDRIKATNTLKCGAEERPGLFGIGQNGRGHGMLLEICRAVALAVLPPDGKIEFHAYESEKSFDLVRKNEDDLYFLSYGEIQENELADRLALGPTVFNMAVTVMVPDTTPIKTLADLKDQSICYAESGNGERALDAWFAARKIDFQRRGFREDVELRDSYKVQYCLGLAGEATELAKVRLEPKVKPFESRILSEPLAIFPIMATTPVSDGEWTAAVSYVLHTLVVASLPKTDYFAGLGAFKAPEKALGLRENWQKSIVETVGSYDKIYRRNLGEDSPMKLPRGPNAQVRDGGLLMAPWVD